MQAGIAGSRRSYFAVFVAVSMVLSLVFVYAMPRALGQGGNPPSVECDSADWNGEYWKIQVGDDGQPTGSPETSGKIGADDIDLSITNLVVSWTNDSDFYVFRIVEKGGQYDDVNSGMWGPGEGGTFSVEASISHITFCFTGETPPDPGKIIVEKEVTAGSDTSQEFDFTASYDGDGFSLADGESDDSGDLAADNYSVSETVPAGWTLQSATCDNGDDPDSIDLEAGETVTCTFVNDEDEVLPEPGEIIVEKVVTGDASQEFEFTFETTGFTLSDNTLAHGQSSSSGDIPAGDGYSVSEDVPSGWTLVDATCDDGSPITNIDVSEGETVTCTFTNTIENLVGASILVTVDGECVVVDDQGQGVIDVVVSVDNGATVVIRDSAGEVVETLTSDGSVNVTAGATYTWEATPNTGFEFPSGSETSGSIDIEDCTPIPPPPPPTPDEVMASILVTVDSFCEDGDGFIDIDLSVAGGATVVVSDSDGDVMGTLTADGTITVPEGATYDWVATPSEGFEFPPGFVASGSITIESCSDPETLPFTGMDLDVAAAFAAAFLGAGITVLASQWRREEQ